MTYIPLTYKSHLDSFILMDIQVQFGKRIKELCRSKYLTQKAFALISKVDRIYMTAVENGKCNVAIKNNRRAGIGIIITEIVYYFEPRKNFNTFRKSKNITLPLILIKGTMGLTFPIIFKIAALLCSINGFTESHTIFKNRS